MPNDGEANTFELHFNGPIYQFNSNPPSTDELELVEHESGSVLLDENRPPTYGHYTVGNCETECWSAEAAL